MYTLFVFQLIFYFLDHILYGKKVKLESPMVAMKKVRTVQGDQTVTEYHVETVIRSKLIFKARPKPIIVVPKKM